MRLSILPVAASFLIACAASTIQAAPPDSGRSLADLLEQLDSTHTTQERIRAAEALAHYGQSAVPPLIALLYSDDANSRYYACLALVRLGPCAEQAVPDLMAIIAAPGDPLRRAAMTALGRIGSPAEDAAPLLFHLASDSDWEVRRYAVDALAEIGSCVVPMLLDQLQEDDQAARRSACEVLGRMGPKAKEAVPRLTSLAMEATETEREAVFAALAGIAAPAGDDLIRMLRHENGDVRRLAAKALGRMRDEGSPAISALCNAVQDQDANVRFWAVWAIGQIGGSGREIADALLLASLDQDADVRWQTVAALQKVNIGESVEQVLINLLKDPHPAVRARAEQIGVR